MLLTIQVGNADSVIGGFLGGLAGGIAGSWGAGTLGEYLIDEAYQGG